MEVMQSTLFFLTLSLFILMDPFGNIPIYIAMLKDFSAKRQMIIIIRELTIALFVILLFTFMGKHLLDFLRVKQETISIAGGLILFMIAIKMIFPRGQEPFVDTNMQEEPFIVPLAIPLIAGPSILAAIVIYSHQEGMITLLISICIAWVFSTLILLSAPFLKQILGIRGIMAGERLMGLVLTLISVQMLLDGVHLFINK